MTCVWVGYWDIPWQFILGDRGLQRVSHGRYISEIDRGRHESRRHVKSPNIQFSLDLGFFGPLIHSNIHPETPTGNNVQLNNRQNQIKHSLKFEC